MSYATKAAILATLLASMSMLFSQCGEQQKGSNSYSGLNANSKTMDIPIAFSPDPGLALGLVSDSSGLELVAATSYSMSLAGCSSALTGTVTASTVKVIVGDSNCLLKLSSFVTSGNTYVPKTGSGFTTWLAGDTATFVNQSNANDLYAVKVVSQLTQAQVSSSDVVSYSFYQANAGASQSVAQSLVSQAQSVGMSGEEAPNYVLSTNGSPASTGSVAPMVFSGVNSSGAGQFVFNLYCAVAMGTSGKCGVSTSDTGALTQTSIKYKLISDSYGVSTGSTLSLTQLGTIMASGTTTVTSANALTDNNKGFATATLTGPGPLSSNPNMILILTGGNSYTYFSIQVSGVSNN